MGKHTDQRDRTLLLARILYEETDESNPLPLTALVERLAQRGVTAERKSLYRDMAALRRHGLSVSFRPGSAGGWYLSGRAFSAPELRGVIDAVSVYPCLSETMRAALLRKLQSLAPKHRQDSLNRPVTCATTCGTPPEELRAVLDRIHTACRRQVALRFAVCTYDREKRKRPAGACRVVSPKGLLWTDQGYQLLGWDHRDHSLRLYRPDQMDNVQITGMPAKGQEADLSAWASTPFGLDPARRERMAFLCSSSMAGEILDRFGYDVELCPDGAGFSFTAEVSVGPAFWGWAAAHSGHLSITAPAWAAKFWQEHYQPKPSDPRLRSRAV